MVGKGHHQLKDGVSLQGEGRGIEGRSNQSLMWHGDQEGAGPPQGIHPLDRCCGTAEGAGPREKARSSLRQKEHLLNRLRYGGVSRGGRCVRKETDPECTEDTDVQKT